MAESRPHRNRRDAYHLHVELEREYEPLSKKNKPNTLSSVSKANHRLQGNKNLDLWVDGRLYPKNPLQNSTPPFKDITTLLNFVGEGYNGLLGYTHHLEASSNVLKLERDLLEKENNHLKQRMEQYVQKLRGQKETILVLEKQKEKLRLKQTSLGLRKRERKLRDYQQLKLKSGGIKKRIHAVK